jgi:hypothetical protein
MSLGFTRGGDGSVDATSWDGMIVLVVVLLRFGVPLLIPIFPLPAIVACLVIDGVDQTVFQTQLSPTFWSQVENSYQGYDKALDVYYLCLAYTATMRNWTNPTALLAAQVLWLYRLAGVTVFELIHDPSEPSSWRWLLLVFPNTFEYFFIAYETIRLRWDPLRLARRAVIGLAAAIWIFIKLPQEWWIHVAQLDFTDVAAEHTWVAPAITGVLLAAGVGIYGARSRIPAADWRLHVSADPLPPEFDTARKRSDYRVYAWRLPDWNLVEKVVLTGLVCVIFSQILPGTTATPMQVIFAVGTLVVINSAMGLAFARRRRSIENTALQFIVLVAINEGLVWSATLLTPRFQPDHATFFILLISLIVILYDRYRPIREFRRGHGAVRPAAAPAPS